jgi:hypothetical protein
MELVKKVNSINQFKRLVSAGDTVCVFLKVGKEFLCVL